jgi:hypothetical protein
MAEPVFDFEPTVDDVNGIQHWRWPIIFPLAAALRRKIVTSIGSVPIPPTLDTSPVMRGGGGVLRWMALVFRNGEEHVLGPTTDLTLPPYQIVNDTALKELLVSNWRPTA